MIKSVCYYAIKTSAESKIWDNTRLEMEDFVWDQIFNPTRDQVCNQVIDQICERFNYLELYDEKWN